MIKNAYYPYFPQCNRPGGAAVWLSYQLYQNKFVTLDPQLKEVSGIEFDKRGRLWAINDSGDGPFLYQVDDKGKVQRRVQVVNAKNIDWEDMTQNEFGHFFLGDFGNNDNLRPLADNL